MKLLVTEHYISLAKKTLGGCPLTLLLQDLMPKVNIVVGAYDVFLNSAKFKLDTRVVDFLTLCRGGTEVASFIVTLTGEDFLQIDRECAHERDYWASDPRVDVNHIYKRCSFCGITLDVEKRRIEA